MSVKFPDKYLLIFLFNIFLPISICYESQYFFCNNRIYSDFSGLTYDEINNLCILITRDDRFVILLTNKITYPDDYSYTIFSENFLKTQCTYNSINCIYDFAITIYVKGGRVLISSGSTAKNYVSQNDRMSIINSIIDYLKRGEYYSAILNSINLIRNIYPYSNMNNNYNNGGNNNNYHRDESSNGISFLTIFLIIICIGFVICLCYYFFQKKEEEEQIIDDNDISSTEIHNHLSQLENLIKEIRKSSPPMISISKCIICMKEITYNDNNINQTPQYIEMGNLNDNNSSYQINNNINYQNESNDPLNTRFSCQHVYHTSCLTSHGVNYCLMCINNNSTNEINNNGRIIILNKHNKQVIDEGHIKTFIQNLNLIYNNNELNNYAQHYPTEFDTFNTTLLLGLTTCWGISMMAPMPTYQVNNYNYYGDNYNSNNNNNNYNHDGNFGNYNTNDNSDTVTGLYQPPNFEDHSGTATARFGNSIYLQGDNNNNGNFGDDNYDENGGDF